MSNANEIRFFYNGLKIGKGKLQKGHWSRIEEWTTQTGKVIPTQLVCYAKSYEGFSKEVHEAFTVKNDSDIMTDYYEKDRLSIYPDHPLYEKAMAANMKAEARREKHYNRPQGMNTSI